MRNGQKSHTAERSDERQAESSRQETRLEINSTILESFMRAQSPNGWNSG